MPISLPLYAGAAVTLFLAGIGAVIWLLRLEGRINAHEVIHSFYRESLARIEQKVDYLIQKKP